MKRILASIIGLGVISLGLVGCGDTAVDQDRNKDVDSWRNNDRYDREGSQEDRRQSSGHAPIVAVVRTER